MNEPIAMDSNVVLEVSHLSKKFCRNLRRSLRYGVADLAGELLARKGDRDTLRLDEFWAVQDVSFSLHKGETLGIVGHNGAGKSTLLKILNGLIKPDIGNVKIRGRIGALIELGSGFNPILTGRENIYINAAVLGLKREEVDRQLDAIIDFAEIGDFIDAPTQSYSSGMRVRLGFSIAAHLSPDILLIDEILSVGDASFRERCIRHFETFKEEGGTIILISHNSSTVETVCDQVMMLDHGQVVQIGDPFEVVNLYEQKMLELSRQAYIRLGDQQDEFIGEDMSINNVECRNEDNEVRDTFSFGESIKVRFDFSLHHDRVEYPYFIVALSKSGSTSNFVSMVSMLWDDIQLKTLARQSTLECLLKTQTLSPGVYHVFIGVLANISGRLGKKWYLPYTSFTSFTIDTGRLHEDLPGISASHLVSQIPPLMMDHEWFLDGAILPPGLEYEVEKAHT